MKEIFVIWGFSGCFFMGVSGFISCILTIKEIKRSKKLMKAEESYIRELGFETNHLLSKRIMRGPSRPVA